MSLRKLKTSPHYHLDLYVPDTSRPSGRRRVLRSLGTTDPAEAEIRYHRLAADILAAAPPRTSPDSLTLSQLRDRILRQMERVEGLSESTLRNYGFSFASLIGAVGDVRSNRLTRAQVEAWRLASTVRPSTLDRQTAELRAAFSRAVTSGLVEANPFTGLRRLTPGRRERPRFWTDPQAALVLRAADARGEPFGSLAALCYHAGLRISEARALGPSSVEQGRNGRLLLRVGRSKTRAGSRRAVPVAQELEPVVRRLMESGTDPWFLGLSRRWLSKAIVLIVRDAGVPAGTWHTLRHSFAAHHLSRGESILRISRAMGHSSVAITDRYYGHLMPEASDDWIDL